MGSGLSRVRSGPRSLFPFRGRCTAGCMRLLLSDGCRRSASRWRPDSMYLLAGLALACAGCLTEQGLAGVPQGPRSWRIGYAQGCSSGRAAGRGYGIGEKDTARYRVDDLYRKGWNEGFGTCFEEAKEHVAAREKERNSQRLETTGESASVKVRPANVASPTAVVVTLPPATPTPTRRTPAVTSRGRRQVLIERIKRLEGELSELKAELKRLSE